MLKLDFLNKDYSLDEIIDGYTDGNLENFENDEDFLDFIIAVSIGKYFDEDSTIDEKYKKYLDYDQYNINCGDWMDNGIILSMMLLDEYGYYGKKLYQIYKICGKNKDYFLNTCLLIGKYSVIKHFDKETIDTNLSLKNPVAFIDKKLKHNDDKGYDRKYYHEIERSLRHRINESIIKNNEKVKLLREMKSYDDQEIEKEQEQKAKEIPEDYEYDPNNLYFGTEEYDVSGGVLGINFKEVSWFEYMGFNIYNYAVFRNIPNNDYFLVDKNGKCHLVDEIINKNGITITPNSPVRSVNIASLVNILHDSELKLNSDSINNEEEISYINSIKEMLENGKLTIDDLNNYHKIIYSLFEMNYGLIFDREEEDYSIEDSSPML